MVGQMTLFDWMSEQTPDINNIPESEAARIVGERIGVQFVYNSHLEEWRAKVGKMNLFLRYGNFSKGINGGRLSLGAGWILRTSGGSAPFSGIDEAVEYLKSRIANMGKYEKEIDRWQA